MNRLGLIGLLAVCVAMAAEVSLAKVDSKTYLKEVFTASDKAKISLVYACMNGGLSARVEADLRTWFFFSNRYHPGVLSRIALPSLQSHCRQDDTASKMPYENPVSRVLRYYAQDEKEWYKQEANRAMQQWRDFVNFEDLAGNTSERALRIRKNRRAFLDAIEEGKSAKKIVELGKRSLRLKNPIAHQFSKLSKKD